MKYSALSFALVALLFGSVTARAQKKIQNRLEACAVVLKEVLGAPDQGVPQELLDRAECVGVFPSTKKLAIGFSVSYGRGAFVCRKNNGRGPWGPPAMYGLGGPGIGFQLGGRSADFVLLIMNPRGMQSLLKSKFKLGADMSAAAGPKGRTLEAATDATMRAEILTYSRTRGLFAGVSLEGNVLKQDDKANRKLYGRKIKATDILLNANVSTPAAGQQLVQLLRKYSPKNISDVSELRRPDVASSAAR